MKSRNSDLRKIVLTGYSFEEWFNWEAYLACIDSKLQAEAKPSYSRFGLSKSQIKGDLYLEAPNDSALLEFGTVHDWTGDRQLEKLERDRQKLLEAKKDKTVPIELIQALVLASKVTDFVELPIWKDWLNKLSFWTMNPDYHNEVKLLPEGKIIIMAWII
jgi:hypothetical protein